jgi:uracil-DNA glycosylase family 4
VGLAPGLHGANRTGRPFTGDYAGLLLYDTLHACGFSNQAIAIEPNDGLKLKNCRITNAVKCLPPANKPLPKEISECNGYLSAELNSLKQGSVILALGGIAHKAVLAALGQKPSTAPFKHGGEHTLNNGLTLLTSYHCSRYNTQTKRLTPAMFRTIVKRAKTLVDG